MKINLLTGPALGLSIVLAGCGGADSEAATDETETGAEDVEGAVAPADDTVYFEDQSRRISADDVGAVNARLAEVSAETGKAIHVVSLDSIGSADPAEYAENERSQRGADALILIVVMDRNIVTVGEGVDDAISEDVEEAMGSRFDQNDFMGGFTAGIDTLAQALGS